MGFLFLKETAKRTFIIFHLKSLGLLFQMSDSRNILTFRLTYFFAALFLFFTEVVIALFVHDEVVRPYFGDFLVVILLYCFLRTFLRLPVFSIAFFVLLFSYVIEFLQYLHFIKWLGLADSSLARLVLGNSFAWADIVAYTIGVIVVLILEKIFAGRSLMKEDNF